MCQDTLYGLHSMSRIKICWIEDTKTILLVNKTFRIDSTIETTTTTNRNILSVITHLIKSLTFTVHIYWQALNIQFTLTDEKYMTLELDTMVII